MSQLKTLAVYRYHDGAISPNPWKVTIILNELSLPWEMKIFDRSDPDIRSKEPLVSMSPNGRMPVFKDPNTGIKLWESGAIIEYLLEVYDTENRLSYTTTPQKYEQNSWKHFQMSGQGPYFGQLTWFKYLHHEKVASAQERYEKEIKRVLGVIDQHLQRTNRPYLVGEKLCFADLMFVPWNWQVTTSCLGPDFDAEWKKDYPKCWEWNQRLASLDSVQRAEKFAVNAWHTGTKPELEEHTATVEIPK